MKSWWWVILQQAALQGQKHCSSVYLCLGLESLILILGSGDLIGVGCWASVWGNDHLLLPTSQPFVKNPTLSLFILRKAFAADTHLCLNILRVSCGVPWWKGLFTQSSWSPTQKEKWVKETFFSPNSSVQRNILIEESFKAKEANQIIKKPGWTVLFPKMQMKVYFPFYQTASKREV